MSAGGLLSESQQQFFTDACDAHEVSVYREGKDDRVEYTLFFHKDGNKWRIDFSEPIATFNEGVLNTEPGHHQEWYMVGRVVEMINQGVYVDAATAIKN